MDTRPILGVSICSGVGGLDLGLQLALPSLRTILYCEKDLGAAGVLARRMCEGHLHEAPVWDDARTLGGPEVGEYLRRAASGHQILVFGGIPCQPWSVAGAGLGKDDPRDLWPATVGLLEQMDAWGVPAAGVFVENVPGGLKRGLLERITVDLERLGHKTSSIVLSARSVGATHRRRRLFILGLRAGESEPDKPKLIGSIRPMADTEGIGQEWASQGGPTKGGSGNEDPGLADASAQRAEGLGLSGHRPEPGQEGGHFDGRVDGMADPNCGKLGRDQLVEVGDQEGGDAFTWPGDPRLEESFCQRWRRRGDGHRPGGKGGVQPKDQAEGRRPTLADTLLFAPAKVGHEQVWRAVLEEDVSLAPVVLVPRQNQGWREQGFLRAIESSLRRVADGLAPGVDRRSDRLARTGNGVVPLQAAVAFSLLAGSLLGDPE